MNTAESMKQTGIIRKIDDLGRIAIPKELRRSMRLLGGDELEILSYNDGLYLRRPRSETAESKLERVKAEIAEDEGLTAEQINYINNSIQDIIEYCRAQ